MGAFFSIAHPAQLAATLTVLDAVLARPPDHYTVRFLVDLGGGKATPGAVVRHFLSVRLREGTELRTPLVVVVE